MLRVDFESLGEHRLVARQRLSGQPRICHGGDFRAGKTDARVDILGDEIERLRKSRRTAALLSREKAGV